MLECHHVDLRLHADPSRVVVRPFHLAWQASGTDLSRVQQLGRDILSLDAETVRNELTNVMGDFGDRHWQIERVFDQRFVEIEPKLGIETQSLTADQKHLIGAYFCHEYSFAAAALMNPSVVRHPDQSGLIDGSVRMIMSLRAVGEGHISSISFREGIISPGQKLRLLSEPRVATAALLANGSRCEDGPAHVRRHDDCTISGTVIFPVTEAQRNGLEDLRLVDFQHDDGSSEWIGTYTAYSGSAIRSELLRTGDFRDFTLEPISGAAARNKGMALFPRKVNGKYFMIGRQDGKNLFLLSSDRLNHWDDGALLIGPEFPWEFIQIGNCGAPIELDQGWLVLTHGVGAMRKYSIGAILLDKDDPSKVIGRTRLPILSAADEDREGYVPNVVYTCGALRVGDDIFVPYGVADSSVCFAFFPIEALLQSLAD